MPVLMKPPLKQLYFSAESYHILANLDLLDIISKSIAVNFSGCTCTSFCVVMV